MPIPHNLVLYTIQCPAEKWEKHGWCQAENEESAIKTVCGLYGLPFSVCKKLIDNWWACKKKGSEYAFLSVDVGATSLVESIGKFKLTEHISFHLDNRGEEPTNKRREYP